MTETVSIVAAGTGVPKLTSHCVKYSEKLMEKKREQEMAEAKARESAEEVNTIN